jgi:hypothetical protein
LRRSGRVGVVKLINNQVRNEVCNEIEERVWNQFMDRVGCEVRHKVGMWEVRARVGIMSLVRVQVWERVGQPSWKKGGL